MLSVPISAVGEGDTSREPATVEVLEVGEVKLRPCPFCGMAAKMSANSEGSHMAWCPGCGCRTSREDSEWDAVSTWNRRAPRFSVEERKRLGRILSLLDMIPLTAAHEEEREDIVWMHGVVEE